jgi:hypothetical protein
VCAPSEAAHSRCVRALIQFVELSSGEIDSRLSRTKAHSMALFQAEGQSVFCSNHRSPTVGECFTCSSSIPVVSSIPQPDRPQ